MNPGNGVGKNADPLPLPTNGSEHPPLPPMSLWSALSTFNAHLLCIHSALPGNSALILVTGHSNPIPMLELSAKRQRWERLVKTLGGMEDIPKEERWMSEDDRKLEDAVSEAREGMAFFCVKPTVKKEVAEGEGE